MPRTRLGDAAELAVSDVIHGRFSSLPASATIGDVRDWFAASQHRRMAVLADGGRYLGSLTPAQVGGDLEAERLAVDVAHSGPTVAPDAPARDGEALALSSDARRVPVVDHDGRLVGIVSVTEDLTSFCGTSER